MHCYRNVIHRVRSWLRRPGVRRAKAYGLALLGLWAAGSRGGGEAQDDKGPIHVVLEADETTAKAADEGGSIDLAGGVKLELSNLPGAYERLTMDAERIHIDLGAGDISAPEGALFRVEGGEFQGDSLFLNIHDSAFRLENARADVLVGLGKAEVPFHFDCELLEASDGEANMHKTRLTGCDNDHPHYMIRVKRARYEQDRKVLTVFGGDVELYGMRVPIPVKLKKGFGTKSRDFDLIPLPGRSTMEGWYMPYGRRFTSPDDALDFSARVRFSQRLGFGGGLYATHRRPDRTLWATLARRDPIETNITDILALDSAPEFGAEFTREQGDSLYAARVVAGHYREGGYLSGRTAKGESASALLDWDWLPGDSNDDTASYWAGLGVRGSLYSTGASYRTGQVRVGGSTPLWEGARGRLDLTHNFIGGSTPFEFDDIDIQSEAVPSLSSPIVGPWSGTITGRYDIDQDRLRDYQAVLSYRHHCLRWSLRYTRSTRTIGVGISLADLADHGPAEPKDSFRRRPIRGGGIVAKQPSMEELAKRPEPMLAPSEPPAHVAEEHLLAMDARERAPGAGESLRRQAPPSTRLAHAGSLQ